MSTDSTPIIYKGFTIARHFLSPHNGRQCRSQQGWLTTHPEFPKASNCRVSAEHPGMEIGWSKTLAQAKQKIDDFQQRGRSGELTAERCEHFRRYWPSETPPVPRPERPMDDSRLRGPEGQAIPERQVGKHPALGAPFGTDPYAALSTMMHRAAAGDALRDANAKAADVLLHLVTFINSRFSGELELVLQRLYVEQHPLDSGDGQAMQWATDQATIIRAVLEARRAASQAFAEAIMAPRGTA